MPITKSAKKALRQSKRRQKQNLKRKEAFRDALKKIKTLVEEKKFDEAKKLIPQAYKSLDKAAKTNAIKKNTASRKKSRLMKLIKKSSAQ
ncbi:30S ribosomal protein S20 [Patescibacteria group bacterium]|nr:30S ribosomal protein S20 [Patescibacteria group bacterium]